MSSSTKVATAFESATVSVRVKISAGWTAMLFVFVYVDLFSLYRADIRTEIEAGQISGFTINQSFLLATTAYVAIPALMLFLSLVLPARGARIGNIALSILYAVTIVGASVGEGNYYYLLGSALEVALLAAIAFFAWTWPKVPASGSANRPGGTPDDLQHTAA